MTGTTSLPWLAWYTRDFATSTRGWTLLEKGAYREALDIQWEAESLPSEPDEIRQLIGATRIEWRRLWPNRLEVKFPIDADGRRRNRRLEQVRADARRLRLERAAAGRLGAESRWGRKDSSAMAPPSQSHATANGKSMPSTVISTSTYISPDPSERRSRKRAGPATPAGQPARLSGGEEPEEIRNSRRKAAELVAQLETEKRLT
jgi:uncharacterized protein YdaU (DUF1376 family)